MYLDHFFTQPHGLVWFAVLILPTKPNRNIRKTLIKYTSSRPIFIEIEWKLSYNDIIFSLVKFLLYFFYQKCIYVLLKLLENN